MSKCRVYSIEAIQKIATYSLLPEVPESVMRNINLLQTQLRITNTSTTTRKQSTNQAPPSEWTDMLLSSHKLSKINDVRDPSAEIRSLINKISEKNFDELLNQIIDVIVERNNHQDTLTHEVKNMVFHVASINRFNSKIYARLYKQLCATFPEIHSTFNPEDEVESWFSNIAYVDPEQDYSKFCEYTKKNEQRRSITAFYRHLVEEGVLPSETMAKFAYTIVVLLYQWINEPNKMHETDELIELVAILYNKDLFTETLYIVDHRTIYEIILVLSNSKSSQFLSLSQKSIFKCKDIIEGRCKK